MLFLHLMPYPVSSSRGWIKRMWERTEEMAQQSGALTAIIEDPNPVPSSHVLKILKMYILDFSLATRKSKVLLLVGKWTQLEIIILA